MSKKIWAVSSGSYSDYRVHALFESEVVAEAVATTANGLENYDDHFVEGFQFYAKDEIPEPLVVYRGTIELFDDGTYGPIKVTSDGPKFAFQHYMTVPPPRRPHIRQVRAPMYQNKGARLEVSARTDTMVRKVINDRLMEHKALGPRRVPEINP